MVKFWFINGYVYRACKLHTALHQFGEEHADHKDNIDITVRRASHLDYRPIRFCYNCDRKQEFHTSGNYSENYDRCTVCGMDIKTMWNKRWERHRADYNEKQEESK